MKRSTNELDNLLNEIISSDEIPFHIATDREMISNAPLMQYLLLRSSSKFLILMKKIVFNVIKFI